VTNRLATLKAWIDDVLVDGIVNGSGDGVFEVGSVARKMQSGFVQNYFLIMSVGLIFLIGYWIF
jgi:putative NADPH-quinone reductase